MIHCLSYLRYIGFISQSSDTTYTYLGPPVEPGLGHLSDKSAPLPPPHPPKTPSLKSRAFSSRGCHVLAGGDLARADIEDADVLLVC